MAAGWLVRPLSLFVCSCSLAISDVGSCIRSCCTAVSLILMIRSLRAAVVDRVVVITTGAIWCMVVKISFNSPGPVVVVIDLCSPHIMFPALYLRFLLSPHSSPPLWFPLCGSCGSCCSCKAITHCRIAHFEIAIYLDPQMRIVRPAKSIMLLVLRKMHQTLCL